MHSTDRKPRTLTDEKEAHIQNGIAEDPDNPEWTESIQRQRGRPSRPPSGRFRYGSTPDVINAFKATGKGWQGRINEALRKARSYDGVS